MGESIVWVVGAFLLYLVVLPLLGALLGLVVITLMPYFAGIAIIWIVMNVLGYGAATFWLWIIASIWAVTVFAARKRLVASGNALSWHEGHYMAAYTTLRLKKITAQ